MTTPTSRAAYEPYYEVLDRALESEAGVRVKFPDQGAAYQFRIRLHTARQLDRELNRESRQPDDPSYGISDYDKLIVRVRAEGPEWWLYIQPTRLDLEIEELSA